MLDAIKNLNIGNEGAMASANDSVENASVCVELIGIFLTFVHMLKFLAMLFGHHQSALYVLVVVNAKQLALIRND